MTITVDFGVLALILSLACAAYMAYHAKCEDRRFKAILEYIDKCDAKQREDFRKEMEDKNKAIFTSIDMNNQDIGRQITDLSNKVAMGLSEINPNFEAAKKAMGQVNDMASGLMGLFNYDPITALRDSRTERAGDFE